MRRQFRASGMPDLIGIVIERKTLLGLAHRNQLVSSAAPRCPTTLNKICRHNERGRGDRGISQDSSGSNRRLNRALIVEWLDCLVVEPLDPKGQSPSGRLARLVIESSYHFAGRGIVALYSTM